MNQTFIMFVSKKPPNYKIYDCLFIIILTFVILKKSDLMSQFVELSNLR